jgi:diaminopropionate ammonia-lyase
MTETLYYHINPAKNPAGVAAGLAALFALLRALELEEPRRFLGLGETSRILLFNTEGDTDPEGFSEIVGARATTPPG